MVGGLGTWQPLQGLVENPQVFAEKAVKYPLFFGCQVNRVQHDALSQDYTDA